MKFFKNRQNIITCIIVFVLILLCIIPMGLNPNWNGERKFHLNQYELMGDSILHGRLDLDIEVDPKLNELNNPYDPTEREQNGVEFAWDHAFYNGKYYMYFGVVPAVLVFAPFQFITGHALNTYHATQLFVSIFIIGIFVLFAFFRTNYFKQMKWSVYILLSTAISLMSIWYSIAAPSLYCTAITSALAFEIWSIYLFFRSIEEKKSGHSPYRFLIGGSILGALAFGCRPTIALANLIIIPVYYRLLKSSKENTWKIYLKLTLTLLPYLVVGVALMWYNYARFGSVLEFGESYQLTIGDMGAYESTSFNLPNILNGFFESLLKFDGFTSRPPFIGFAGLLWEFPLLLLAIFCVTKKEVREKLREFRAYICSFLTAIFLIIISVATFSPYILERYHMDINFLFGIICFIIIGCSKKLPAWLIYVFSILTIIMCAWLFLVPCDHNIGEALFGH